MGAELSHYQSSLRLKSIDLMPSYICGARTLGQTICGRNFGRYSA